MSMQHAIHCSIIIHLASCWQEFRCFLCSNFGPYIYLLRVLCAETAAHRQCRDQCYTWFQLWLSALNYRQTFALDPSNEDNPRYLSKDFGRRKGHRMAMEGTERVSARGV